MPFLIDGHNVIAALPDIDLEDPDDEAQLVVKLRAWTGRERRKAIVIFDGGIPGGPSRVLSSSEVRVVFAARHYSTADRIIKERLSHLPDAPNWTVVSSDHEVLDNARMTGAKTLSAQAFVERLNRSFEVEKEKPEGASAAEVEMWLEVFETPESPQVSTPPSSTRPVSKKQARRAEERRAAERAAPETPPVRATRSIAEQMGRPTPPPTKREKPAGYEGKPTEVSSEEVESWLEVFHDEPESVSPPKPRPRAKPRKPKPLVVKKHGALSDEEVESWLEVFGDEPETPTPTSKPASEKPSKRSSKKDKLKPSKARLVKRKRKLIPIEDEEPSGLSKEDEELWFRLYGHEDK
ncbi:MAG: NYN domain-containing protein [Anaerolineae bacterium]